MKKMKLVLVMLALTGASTVEAARFGVKDWEIVCDNTRRCEAVGYQTDESGSAPVALWLGRDAGAGAALEAKLSVVTADDKDTGPLAIVAGKLTLAGLKADTALTAEQIARLMPQLLDAETAKVSDGKGHWLLSLAGLKAALLKMDDQQGAGGYDHGRWSSPARAPPARCCRRCRHRPCGRWRCRRRKRATNGCWPLSPRPFRLATAAWISGARIPRTTPALTACPAGKCCWCWSASAPRINRRLACGSPATSRRTPPSA